MKKLSERLKTISSFLKGLIEALVKKWLVSLIMAALIGGNVFQAVQEPSPIIVPIPKPVAQVMKPPVPKPVPQIDVKNVLAQCKEIAVNECKYRVKKHKKRYHR